MSCVNGQACPYNLYSMCILFNRMITNKISRLKNQHEQIWGPSLDQNPSSAALGNVQMLWRKFSCFCCVHVSGKKDIDMGCWASHLLPGSGVQEKQHCASCLQSFQVKLRHYGWLPLCRRRRAHGFRKLIKRMAIFLMSLNMFFVSKKFSSTKKKI